MHLSDSFDQILDAVSHVKKAIWRVSGEYWPVRGLKNWQFFGLQNCVKFVLFHTSILFGIKITRNSTFFHDITPLFDIPDSMSTMVG